jgi:hypothetical protein
MDRWDSPHYETWLASIPIVAARQVEAGVVYLLEHGRGAVLPDVRHRIQISKHFPTMSEVRVLHHANPHDLILRLLTSFVDADNTLLVLVGGDKAAWQRKNNSDWYDHAVPVGDHIISWYLTNGTQR